MFSIAHGWYVARVLPLSTHLPLSHHLINSHLKSGFHHVPSAADQPVGHDDKLNGIIAPLGVAWFTKSFHFVAVRDSPVVAVSELSAAYVPVIENTINNDIITSLYTELQLIFVFTN